jgi:DNA-binding CsgD family transcriptional regulator
MSSLDAELLELGGDITAALEDVQLPASLLDRNGEIRWQNKASISLRGDRVGTDFTALVAPKERPDARDLITRILCRGEPAELTLDVATREGTYSRIQLSAVPVRGGGTVVAVFGLGHPAPTQTSRNPLTATKLTGRQAEILHLLADGRSTDEIASQLSLSITTVRNHIANLIAALGVHSRLQAVVAASKAGLLAQ